MTAPIVFYFDFSSPYSYLAAEQIEALTQRHGRRVDYRPTLLGAVFKVSGQRPLTEIPLKGDYARRDFARSARYAGVPFRLPDVFPVSTVQAARAFLAATAIAPGRAGDIARAIFRAYFVQGRDITDPGALGQALAAIGIDGAAVLSAMTQADIKEALKAQVEESLARGVFGAPFFLVDDEPFWGSDRLPQIDRWLDTGPY